MLGDKFNDIGNRICARSRSNQAGDFELFIDDVQLLENMARGAAVRVAELEIADKTLAKWMDVIDEMSINRGEHTVDFWVWDNDGGKYVIEPRQVQGIYEAMRQHFSTYRTTRVERAEHRQYEAENEVDKMKDWLATAPHKSHCMRLDPYDERERGCTCGLDDLLGEDNE